MAMSPGFESLRSLAENKLEELTKKLKYPNSIPSLRSIAEVIATQSEIKGLEWWIEKVDSIKQKFEKEV